MRIAKPSLLLLAGAQAAVMTHDESEAVVEKHNYLRCKHGAQPLAWDWEIADAAQEFADKGDFGHNSPTTYGENIAWGYDMSGVKATELWYGEISETFAATGKAMMFMPEYGHYSQLVWNASTSLGCGSAFRNGRDLVVCWYSPAGNLPDQFGEQVHGFQKEDAGHCTRAVLGNTEEWSWGFRADKEDSCRERGSLFVRQYVPSAGEPAGDDDLLRFDVLGFELSRSDTGLPEGSTTDGVYAFKPVLGVTEPTQMVINKVTEHIRFTGQYANDGSLSLVTTTSKDDAGVKLGPKGRVQVGGDDEEIKECSGAMSFTQGDSRLRLAKKYEYEAVAPLGRARTYPAVVVLCTTSLLLATAALVAVHWRRRGTVAPSLLEESSDDQVDGVDE